MMRHIEELDGLIGADLIEDLFVGTGVGAVILREGIDHERMAGVSIVVGVSIDELLDDLLVFLNRRALGKIDLIELGDPVARCVNVPVHETGNDHTAVQVDDIGLVADEIIETRLIANIDDLIVADRHSSRGITLGHHGLNGAVLESDSSFVAHCRATRGRAGRAIGGTARSADGCGSSPQSTETHEAPSRNRLIDGVHIFHLPVSSRPLREFISRWIP